MLSISKRTFSAYYWLTKPEIIYGNAIPASAGLIYASRGSINLALFCVTLVGISLVIASGCVFNNYFDRKIDSKMSRTKSRALVTGEITPFRALYFAIVLGVLGFIVLSIFTNATTVAAGFIGLFDYVLLYGVAKRRSSNGTLVGTISGAMPPVAGYVAVTGTFDIVAVLIFLILVFWQMPHFYAIAIYRLKDYKDAELPVLPVVAGVPATVKSILLYVIAFTITASALTIRGYTGTTYLIGMLIISSLWLGIAHKGLNTKNPAVWGREVFRFSLIVIMMFSILLSLDHWLP